MGWSVVRGRPALHSWCQVASRAWWSSVWYTVVGGAELRGAEADAQCNALRAVQGVFSVSTLAHLQAEWSGFQASASLMPSLLVDTGLSDLEPPQPMVYEYCVTRALFPHAQKEHAADDTD